MSEVNNNFPLNFLSKEQNGRKEKILCAAIHQKTPLIALGCENLKIQIWSLKNKTLISSIFHVHPQPDLHRSQDNLDEKSNSKATNGGPAGGEPSATGPGVPTFDGKIVAATFSPCGKYLATAAVSYITSYNNKNNSTTNNNNQNPSVKWNENKEKGINSSLSVDDEESAVHYHSMNIWEVLLDGSVKLLHQDVHIPLSKDFNPLPFLHQDTITAMQFGPDEEGQVSLLASASKDTSVRLWEFQSRTHTRQILRQHSDTVTSLSFSSDGRIMVSSSLDCTIVVWSLTRIPVAKPSEGIHNKIGAAKAAAEALTATNLSEALGGLAEIAGAAADLLKRGIKSKQSNSIVYVKQHCVMTMSYLNDIPEPVRVASVFPGYKNVATVREYTVSVGLSSSLVILRVSVAIAGLDGLAAHSTVMENFDGLLANPADIAAPGPNQKKALEAASAKGDKTDSSKVQAHPKDISCVVSMHALTSYLRQRAFAGAWHIMKKRENLDALSDSESEEEFSEDEEVSERATNQHEASNFIVINILGKFSCEESSARNPSSQFNHHHQPSANSEFESGIISLTTHLMPRPQVPSSDSRSHDYDEEKESHSHQDKNSNLNVKNLVFSAFKKKPKPHKKKEQESTVSSELLEADAESLSIQSPDPATAPAHCVIVATASQSSQGTSYELRAWTLNESFDKLTGEIHVYPVTSVIGRTRQYVRNLLSPSLRLHAQLNGSGFISKFENYTLALAEGLEVYRWGLQLRSKAERNEGDFPMEPSISYKAFMANFESGWGSKKDKGALLYDVCPVPTSTTLEPNLILGIEEQPHVLVKESNSSASPTAHVVNEIFSKRKTPTDYQSAFVHDRANHNPLSAPPASSTHNSSSTAHQKHSKPIVHDTTNQTGLLKGLEKVLHAQGEPVFTKQSKEPMPADIFTPVSVKKPAPPQEVIGAAAKLEEEYLSKNSSHNKSATDRKKPKKLNRKGNLSHFRNLAAQTHTKESRNCETGPQCIIC